MTGQPPLTCPPLTAIEVELQPLSLPGGLVIAAVLPFQINAIFSLGGSFAGLLTTINIPATFQVTFESIGAGAEGSLGILNFNLNAGSTQPSVVCPNPMVYDYNLTLNVPGGTMPAGVVFKLVALATITGSPVVAFSEGPLITTT